MGEHYNFFGCECAILGNLPPYVRANYYKNIYHMYILQALYTDTEYGSMQVNKNIVYNFFDCSYPPELYQKINSFTTDQALWMLLESYDNKKH